MIIVTCTSCKANSPYTVAQYLNYLANKSGINNSENIEDNFKFLVDWKIIGYSDKNSINNELRYDFLLKTVTKLIDESGNPYDILLNKGWIKRGIKLSERVKQSEAEEIVNKAVKLINSKEYKVSYSYKYKNNIDNKDSKVDGDVFFNDDNTYKKVQNGEIVDAEFEDVFSFFDISNTYYVDFSDAEIIPLQEENESSYTNNLYNLLASKTHVFNKNGFRVSYQIHSSGIDVHVSRELDKATVYADASINKVKPSFKWTYDSGDIRNCYFNISFNSTSTLGATIGKYGNYYLKFKDLDKSSFLNTLKSSIVQKKDEVEAVIPICQIKTPIPNIPLVYLNMIVGIKLYVSGKIELVMYNTTNVGFEIRDGHPRIIFDHADDLDALVRASGKAALSLNIGLDATKFRLCDIEFDGGVKTEVKTIIHLYDNDGNDNVINSDYSYSTLEEIGKENENVKICGDLSLYWMFDLICNTPKSVMSKAGLSKTVHLLNENNQIFGNMHHIENGQFVKTCTRKSKNNKPVSTSLNVKSSNKITLGSYAEVLNIGDIYEITIKSIPDGYNFDNILISSSNDSIVSVSGNKIIANKAGSAKINVHTNDNKYSTLINILVSTG